MIPRQSRGPPLVGWNLSVPPVPRTIGERIAWSYANLGRAHAALEAGAVKYSRLHHIIRNKLYHGLVSGKISMRSLYDDERLKMTAPRACSYCGSKSRLSVDHLIPRIKGAPDDSDNLVWACRSCNSSKQGRDMLSWAVGKGLFPSVLLLRRYTKLVARYCHENELLDTPLTDYDARTTPFDARLLPTVFPPLSELKLWVEPADHP